VVADYNLTKPFAHTNYKFDSSVIARWVSAKLGLWTGLDWTVDWTGLTKTAV